MPDPDGNLVELAVGLNHLETMGLLMSLELEDQSDGLSEPQRSAQRKLQGLLGVHLKILDIGE